MDNSGGICQKLWMQDRWREGSNGTPVQQRNRLSGHIDQTSESSLCRMCGEKGESVCQLVSK